MSKISFMAMGILVAAAIQILPTGVYADDCTPAQLALCKEKLDVSYCTKHNPIQCLIIKGEPNPIHCSTTCGIL